MPDAPGSQPASQPAGSPAPAPTSPQADLSARRAASQAAIAAGAHLAAGKIPAQPAPVSAPAAVQPATPLEVEAAPSEAGMAALRKQEQHLRRQIADERARMQADFDGQRSAWQRQLEEANAFKQRVEGSKSDPVAALRALGFGEDSFEAISKMLFGHSPAAKADPRFKDVGDKFFAEHRQQTEMQRLAKELADLKSGMSQGQQQAQEQAQISAYADRITKAIDDKAPLARIGLSSNPDGTREALLAIADHLYLESGPSHDLRELPTEAEVLAEYETRRKRMLSELRAEYEALGTAQPPAPAAGAPAPRGQSPAPAAGNRLTGDELNNAIKQSIESNRR